MRRAHSGQRVADRLAVHLAALLQLSLLAHLVDREPRILASNRDQAHARLRPNVHRVSRVHLAAGVVDRRRRSNGRLEVSIARKRLPHPVRTRRDHRLAELAPRLQLGRVLQQRGQALLLHSYNRYPAHEVARSPHVDQRDTTSLVFTVYPDVAISAARKQPADAGRHLRRVQRLSRLLRKLPPQRVLSIEAHTLKLHPRYT